MSTPQEVRKIRLKNDYESMVRIKGDIIAWELTKGDIESLEEFIITFNIRSVTNARPTLRNKHLVRLSIPSNYPASPPEAVMITTPYVFHPNWYSSGKWCSGDWNQTEGLAEFVLRLAKTLQYDKNITNENSAASSDANSFYKQNLNSNMFPTDNQILPDSTISLQKRKKFEISIEKDEEIQKKKKFEINTESNKKTKKRKFLIE